ncbi:MAG: HAD family hydrolase [Chloroflexota bacterium]
MFPTENITTVLFDLDGTLRHSVPTGHDVFWEYAATLGAENTPESRRKAQQWGHSYWADSEDLLIDLETFGKENDEFWQNYTRRHLLALGFSIDEAQKWAVPAHKHMRKNYHPEDIIPDDVPETLTALRKANYTIGLVTNRTDPIDNYMENNGLNKLVDFYFAAGEIGTWKPKPEIFFYALGLANAKPQEAIYVGDNYYADIVGARSANIQPILIDPHNFFPEADCPTIEAIGELTPMLKGQPIN